MSGKDTGRVKLALPNAAQQKQQQQQQPVIEKPQRFLRVNDRSYKEVRRTIVRKQKAGAGQTETNTEQYDN